MLMYRKSAIFGLFLSFVSIPAQLSVLFTVNRNLLHKSANSGSLPLKLFLYYFVFILII